MTQPEITLNGKPFPLPPDRSIAELLRLLALPSDGRGVAVALEGEMIVRGEWNAVRLQANQRVEILVAAQGG